MIAYLTFATFLSAVALTIVMVEIGARLPLTGSAATMRSAVARSTETMRRRGVSDHWKQRILLHCAGTTFRAASLVLGAVMVLAVAATIGVLTIGLAVPQFEKLTFSLPGIALIFAVALIYLPLRRRLRRGG